MFTESPPLKKSTCFPEAGFSSYDVDGKMLVEEEVRLDPESVDEKPLGLAKVSGVQLERISGKKERINAPLFLIHRIKAQKCIFVGENRKKASGIFTRFILISRLFA